MNGRDKILADLQDKGGYKDTLCGKLRKIYAEAELNDAMTRTMRELLIDSMVMAKKMDEKLTYYRETMCL